MDRKSKQTESPFSKRFQREQKRRAILSEASRLFNIYGARATRLSDVAQQLHLNKASLYYYVKSKDDLVYQTYLASCDALEAMLILADDVDATGAEKIVRFIRLYFKAWREIMLGERSHFATLTEIRALKTVHRKRIAARYKALYGRIKSFIREGFVDGSLSPCHETDTALALFGLVQLTVLWLPGIDPAHTERAAEEFVDIVLHGIAEERPVTWRNLPSEAPDSNVEVSGGPSAARQEAFCRVGSAFFNRKGFKGTSLDHIADELAVTKGAFYYNVKDKDDLLRQCFDRSLMLMTKIQERASEHRSNGLEELQRCVLQLFELQIGAMGPLIRFNLIPSLSAQHKKTILARINRVSNRFGSMIEKGMEDGSIRQIDPFVAEQMLMSAIDLSAELPWMRPIEDSLEACRSYFRFYFGGIANAPH